MFSCGEIGIPESGILKEIHEKLLERMLHTHGNELVQNRRMLTNLQEGRVDAPLMLRDSLKVVAATNSRQLLFHHYMLFSSNEILPILRGLSIEATSL